VFAFNNPVVMVDIGGYIAVPNDQTVILIVGPGVVVPLPTLPFSPQPPQEGDQGTPTPPQEEKPGDDKRPGGGNVSVGGRVNEKGDGSLTGTVQSGDWTFGVEFPIRGWEFRSPSVIVGYDKGGFSGRSKIGGGGFTIEFGWRRQW
jgi:hypothetical protein